MTTAGGTLRKRANAEVRKHNVTPEERALVGDVINSICVLMDWYVAYVQLGLAFKDYREEHHGQD